MTQINSISLALLFLLLVIAAVIFAVFSGSRQYVLPLIKNRKSNRRFGLWLFRGELLAWVLFLAFAIYHLFIASPYLCLVFLALAIIIGKDFWKDFIPGLLFRLDNDAEIGDSMRYKKANCTIEGIGPRNLQLRSKDGEIIILPYSHVGEAVIAKSVQKSKLTQFSFEVAMKNDDPAAAAALLEQYILECPWSIPARPPQISFLDDGQYEITSFATDEKSAQRQQMYVQGRVGEA